MCARASVGGAGLEVGGGTSATVVALVFAVSAADVGRTAGILEVDDGLATGLVPDGLSTVIEPEDGGVTAGIFGSEGGLATEGGLGATPA